MAVKPKWLWAVTHKATDWEHHPEWYAGASQLQFHTSQKLFTSIQACFPLRMEEAWTSSISILLQLATDASLLSANPNCTWWAKLIAWCCLTFLQLGLKTAAALLTPSHTQPSIKYTIWHRQWAVISPSLVQLEEFVLVSIKRQNRDLWCTRPNSEPQTSLKKCCNKLLMCSC